MDNAIHANSPSFDIEQIAQRVTEAEMLDMPADDLYHLFSLSPLSSPESSRSGSPVPSEIPFTEPTTFHPPLDSNSIPEKKDNKTERRRKAKKIKSHENRKKKRIARAQEEGLVQARPEAVQKHVLANPPVQAGNDVAEGPTTKGSYIGGKSKFEEKRVYELGDLVGHGEGSLGFTLVEWDGRTSKPLLDSKGRVFGVLAGQVDTPENWDPVVDEAVNLLAAARLRCRFNPDEVLHGHRRGRFPTLRSGISYGGGQTKPTPLRNSRWNEEIVQELNNSEPFKRISGFTSSVLASWAPKLYEYYSNTQEKLLASDPRLKGPFQRGVFSAVTYNLGPSTVCFPHTDFANLPFGWCALTALGKFDHTRGGHLVLWDCGLVIEFPPGSTILFPSALIAHSNTRIGSSETRYSFTAYTAGGLFRWVDHGFQTMQSFKAGLSVQGKLEFVETQARRWEWGLALWRKIS
ncbi:hypothetical protein BJ165DRAFT_1534319 [Panaeolus papilionaceus]|nr:hypothetical protein BJ165DRAFT_1534319 [Panaeolus papilionaceus]